MKEAVGINKAVVILMLSAVMMGPLAGGRALAQSPQSDLLNSLSKPIADPDTRTRVSATHKVWDIGLSSKASSDKILALQLLREPAGSASDQIRIPAVYAIAEIANSSNDSRVKQAALQSLSEPMNSGQLVIRDIAIDAINSIVTRTNDKWAIAEQVVGLLREALNSGNNGARMPAINSITHAVVGANNERASARAVEFLALPLDSEALIGGMEVKMMAIRAIERIAIDAAEESTKMKAMNMLQAFSGKFSTETEARARAASAITKIVDSMKAEPAPKLQRS